jgi:hypothetical protein
LFGYLFLFVFFFPSVFFIRQFFDFSLVGTRFAKLFAPQGIQGYVGTQYIDTTPNTNNQPMASFNQSPNYQG